MYGQRPRENGGRLLLSGVDPNVRDPVARVGALERIGVDNVSVAIDAIGEASERAPREAVRLMAEGAGGHSAGHTLA